MIIKESNNLSEIMLIHKITFGKKEGTEISELVENLFEDKTAKPILSLVAFEKEKIIGNIIFTKSIIKGKNYASAILAPLAILPEFQKQGFGTKLIQTGFEILKKEGYDFIFTYGDPKYYSRFGFESASKLNIIPPQKIPEKFKDAWMIKILNNTKIKDVEVDCSNSLKDKKYW